MKYLIILISLSFLSCSYNTGHRLGADIHDDLPENSIELYIKTLNESSNNFRFLYIEFDIQETADSELVVFHDETIQRMIPYAGNNKVILDSLLSDRYFLERIKGIKTTPQQLGIINLNLDEIKKLSLLDNGYSIPTLEDVLQISKKHKINKPMLVEIKYLKSDYARHKLVELISEYRQYFNIDLIGFKDNFKKSFPEKDKWCRIFKENGFDFKSIGFHRSLCD